MLTQKQNWLYWREWAAVRKHLMADLGWTSSAADEFRHALHVRALGFDKSHDAFTNRDFDATLGIFRALTRADDIDAQLRQLEQPMDRCRRALRDLRDELELSDAYVDGCCRRICHKPVAECNEKELTKVIAALSYHRRRLVKASQDADHAATGENPF
jgi:hypothetical protein